MHHLALQTLVLSWCRYSPHQTDSATEQTVDITLLSAAVMAGFTVQREGSDLQKLSFMWF